MRFTNIRMCRCADQSWGWQQWPTYALWSWRTKSYNGVIMMIIIKTWDSLTNYLTNLPSLYWGGVKRWKTVKVFPRFGFSKLLHHPVKVRNRVVWSQGKVCSSHSNTWGISTNSDTSIFGNAFMTSWICKVEFVLDSTSFKWLWTKR